MLSVPQPLASGDASAVPTPGVHGVRAASVWGGDGGAAAASITCCKCSMCWRFQHEWHSSLEFRMANRCTAR